MKRREFLKIGGTAVAGGVLSACTGEPERLIPFLIAPDDGSLPGVATYYASSCRQCPAGCGTIVRVMEGRAKKIEGNPLSPVNLGKLCARGQASIQSLYHPDRITQPLKRSGERGSGSFVPVSWDDGLAMVLGQLKNLQTGGRQSQLLMLTPRLSGPTGKKLVGTFMQGFGSPLHVEYELFDPAHHAAAAAATYGVAMVPDWDMARTGFLLSFGADFLESWFSPVRYGVAYGQMRQGRPTFRGTFTYVGSRLSMTAAAADRWLPARPGTEGLLALSMAHTIVSENLYEPGLFVSLGTNAEALSRELAPYAAARVSETIGIPPSDIVSLARGFAAIRPAIALAGGSVATHTNGVPALQAIHLLNVLAGNLNREGGLVLPAPGFGGEGQESFASSGLESALAALGKEQVQVAMVHGVDPLHEVPASTDFPALFEAVPFVVSFASFLDETALHADLILPDRTDLESWDDVMPNVGMRERVLGLVQPVVTPLGQTRQFGDVLLGLAHGLGGDLPQLLKASRYEEMLRDTAIGIAGTTAGLDPKIFWTEALRRGGLFHEPARTEGERPVVVQKVRVPNLASPQFEGDPAEYPLHLVPYPSPVLGQGRVAQSSWLQELPDPVTTVVWDSWVEMNPETAKEKGIRHGDLVAVESPGGTVQLPVVLHPGIRPDTVAIPLGRGHHGKGRYAAGRGVNPLNLLVNRPSNEGGPPPWGATRVRIARVSSQGGLVTAGHPEGGYRGELLGI